MLKGCCRVSLQDKSSPPGGVAVLVFWKELGIVAIGTKLVPLLLRLLSCIFSILIINFFVIFLCLFRPWQRLHTVSTNFFWLFLLACLYKTLVVATVCTLFGSSWRKQFLRRHETMLTKVEIKVINSFSRGQQLYQLSTTLLFYFVMLNWDVRWF